MKKIFFLLPFLWFTHFLKAQGYPDPEYLNEVYAYRKDSNRLIRLEKEIAVINAKTKKGFVESSYLLDKEKSAVRFSNFSQYSFVYHRDPEKPSTAGLSAESDSIMKANGLDPAVAEEEDLSDLISLYKMDPSNGKRKIIMMSVNMSSQKNNPSIPLLLHFKKIRDGYYEIVIDKPLPKGEYAFAMIETESMNNQAVIFAFGVE